MSQQTIVIETVGPLSWEGWALVQAATEKVLPVCFFCGGRVFPQDAGASWVCEDGGAVHDDCLAAWSE